MRLIYATLLLISTYASAALPAVHPGESGWYQTGVYTQCNILVDRVGAGAYCNYRLSVMCMQSGQVYITGVASPVVQRLPVTLDLYRPQSGYAPVGSITITSLGSPASIVLNGEGGTWQRVAGYTGDDTCAAPLPVVPTGQPHYPRLCREFGLYWGG